MNRKGISRGAKLSAAKLSAAQALLQGILLSKKLSNKQNGCVILKPIRLITLPF